jgi:type VI secretion system secreted protein Hcp
MRLDLLAWTAAAAMAAIPATALAAVDSYIWFEGEQGNSTEASHKGWFEIKEVSFGVQSGSAVESSNRGAAGGRANLREFTIKKLVDSASPKFQQALTSGRRFPVVKIEMHKAGDPHPYMNYVLTDVLVSKMNMSGAGDKGPEETLTFTYGSMKVQYSGQSGSGQTAPAPSKAMPPNTRTPAPSR